MMGKHPYKVWVDLLRLLECPFKMCYALSGYGSALKDVAVSCEDVGVPSKNVGVPFYDKGVPFQGVECPLMV